MDFRGPDPVVGATFPLARAIAIACVLSTPIACHGDADGSHDTDAGDGAELAFHAELPFLPGFDADSGWLPADSPVAVRAKATATGGVTVDARALATDPMTPVMGSGALASSGKIALSIDARIDTAGIQYEGPVDSFEYEIAASMTSFDPFALEADVPLSAMLPAADLGSVPIPPVPGGSLALSVTGGQLDTSFGGTCADVRDGFAQYTGVLTVSGTISLEATVLIEVPIVGTQSFGPFPFELPIPEITTDTDLGTLSLETGAVVDAMGICAAGTTSSADTGMASGNDDGNDTGGSDTGAAATSSDQGTDTDPTHDPDTSTTSDPTGDPTGGDADYPNPGGGDCPPGTIGVSINSEPANAICLPPCGGGDACPTPADGGAVGQCAFDPDSSYTACSSDADCVDETCVDAVCQGAPEYCVLLCDAMAPCPMAMLCLLGACTYPQ